MSSSFICSVNNSFNDIQDILNRITPIDYYNPVSTTEDGGTCPSQKGTLIIDSNQFIYGQLSFPTCAGGDVGTIINGDNIATNNLNVENISNTRNISFSGGVSIGTFAGLTGQSMSSVAIGSMAGYSFQSGNSVAIGPQCGYTGQNINSVAIGNQAGYTKQGSNAVAIGNMAGNTTQGLNSIAIGYYAGQTSQHINTAIINASGLLLNSDGANRFFAAPIRNAITLHPLYYNPTTKEITYG